MTTALMQCMQENATRYVLVVGIDGRRPVAYGPFHTQEAAEFAAMDYYGTAVTGASARNAFLITELHANVPLKGAWK